MGKKRTFLGRQPMSASPLKADMIGALIAPQESWLSKVRFRYSLLDRVIICLR